MKKAICGVLVCLFVGCGGNSDPGKSSGGAGSDSGKKNAEQNQNGSASTENRPNRSGDSNSGESGQTASSGRIRKASILGATADAKDSNKMKAVALGVHNFMDVYRKFPMAPGKDVNRNDKLSWRVSVLPYLDNGSGEAAKFDLAQPWDSPTNRPLVASPAKEHFTLSNGNLICTITHPRPPKSFRDLLDGSSNTVMLIENPTANGDQWTQPVDLAIDDAVKLVKSLKKGEYLLASFYDGSSFKIYSPEGKNLSDQEISAIFGYNDGQIVNDEIFRPSK